jgi:hypothetical protein
VVPVAADGKGPGDGDDARPPSLPPVAVQGGLRDTLKSCEVLGEQLAMVLGLTMHVPLYPV